MYIASFLALVIAIYFTLVEKKAIVNYYFSFWDISLLKRRKTYTSIDYSLPLSQV